MGRRAMVVADHGMSFSDGRVVPVAASQAQHLTLRIWTCCCLVFCMEAVDSDSGSSQV
jgi:hypothetical protein